MSTNPQMMQYLLMQKLAQPAGATGGMGAPASVAGSGVGPSSQAYSGSALGSAAQLAQKIMLMRALQQKQHAQQPPQSLYGTQGVDPTLAAGQQAGAASLGAMPDATTAALMSGGVDPTAMAAAAPAMAGLPPP